MPQTFSVPDKAGWHYPSCERIETLHGWICQSCYWDCYEARYIDAADTAAYVILASKDWRSKEVRAVKKAFSHK